MQYNLLNVIKRHWKKILLLSVVFVIVYTRYTSDRVVKEIRSYLDNHEFVQYSLSEYNEYFTTNGYETGYTVGEEYLIENDLIKYDSYTENCFAIYGKKNNKTIRITFEEYKTNNQEVSFDTDFDIEVSEEIDFPLAFGIEWDDTYQEVRKKMGLNIINTSLPYIRFISGTIDCKNNEWIQVGKTDRTNYFYWLVFDENDPEHRLQKIYIFADISKEL